MSSSKNQPFANNDSAVCDSRQLSTEDILAHVRLSGLKSNTLSDSQREAQIAQHFEGIMKTLGLDLQDQDLAKSPQRVAKMYVHEIFQGLRTDCFPQITVTPNKTHYDQMIVVKNVNIMTFCQHHFITIHGKAHIAYIPQKYIIGLSKINRIANFFARRPQIQEQLTQQIADALCFILDTQHIAVSITAQHYCVMARGIKDMDSVTKTCDLRGDFKDNPKTRMEYMQHCHFKI